MSSRLVTCAPIWSGSSPPTSTTSLPRPRAVMPGLLATYQDEVPLPAAHWLHLSVRPQFAAILAAAPDDVDPDLDLDEVFDLIQGAILGRIFVPAIAARGTGIDSTVEMVLRMLTPVRR